MSAGGKRTLLDRTAVDQVLERLGSDTAVIEQRRTFGGGPVPRYLSASSLDFLETGQEFSL